MVYSLERTAEGFSLEYLNKEDPMPDDTERRCRRCDTYLNDDGTCINRHCPSNRETLPAPAKTAPLSIKSAEAQDATADCRMTPGAPSEALTEPAPDQNARTDESSLDFCDFTDANNITSVESPQAKDRYPERARSGMRTRVDPNAANADDDDSKSSAG